MKKRISESITGRNELVNLEMIEATNGFFETFQVASLDRIKYDLLFHLKVVGFLLLLQYQILFPHLSSLRAFASTGE